jgi:hypothetical protein
MIDQSCSKENQISNKKAHCFIFSWLQEPCCCNFGVFPTLSSISKTRNGILKHSKTSKHNLLSTSLSWTATLPLLFGLFCLKVESSFDPIPDHRQQLCKYKIGNDLWIHIFAEGIRTVPVMWEDEIKTLG